MDVSSIRFCYKRVDLVAKSTNGLVNYHNMVDDYGNVKMDMQNHPYSIILYCYGSTQDRCRLFEGSETYMHHNNLLHCHKATEDQAEPTSFV